MGFSSEAGLGGEVGGKETARPFSGYLLGFVQELFFCL